MPWLDLLGQYSFGIYFVHFIFITISMEVFQRLRYTLDFSVITFLIYYVFIMLASVGSVFLLKKLTGNYSRYLIGS
jgi:peptidoglycan/LPS O-acetylase OafA/YrhL